jgi:carbon-monoxide dehydrogenase large subunit
MPDYVYVGKKVERPDAIGKVTGETQFAADINQPYQLYGAMLRSPHAYANIISIDISEAQAMEGVITVITGEDEHTGIGHYSAEMPTLAYKRVMYHGEPVVAVAAESLDIAHAALKTVKIEYEVLKPVLTMEESMHTDTVFHDWSKLPCHHEMYYEQGTNIAHHTAIYNGDAEKGFAESEYIIEGVYETAGLQHVCIEGHVAIAKFDRDGLVVWTCAQSPFFMRGQLAKAFSLPQNKVRMIIPPIGGGFGNKWELRAEPVAAALAKRAHGRPVKVVFTRHDEFMGAYSRGAMKIWIKSGISKDGKIIARKIYNLQDSGAYVNGAPRLNYLSSYAAAGPYNIDNIAIDAYTMITNKLPTSAYRGFGIQEVSFAAECHTDDICEACGFDRLDFRLKNVVHDGDTYFTGEKLFSIPVEKCIRIGAERIGLSEKFEKVTPDGKLRGRGLCVTGKITGTPSGSSILIKLNEDGSVDVLKGGTDMGQGNNSIISIFAAEALQMDIGKINVAQTDTLYSPYEKSTTGSRLTFHMGRVIVEAAEDIHRQLKIRLGEHWGCPAEDVTIEGGVIIGRDKAWNRKELPMNELGKARVLIEQDPIVGRGTYNTVHIWDKPDKKTGRSERISVMWFYTCQAVQVLVDPKTGHVEVEKVVAVHDVGQAINNDSIKGNIEGGVLQGLGHTLYEALEWDGEGHMLNANMADYKVPTAKEAGYELDIQLVEEPHPEGPYGCKGIGELPVCGVAAATSNAILDATGIRMNKIPIKPDDMYLALKNACKTTVGGKK